VVTSAISQLAESDVDMSAVAETFTNDAGLSLQLLKTVNSATFAPRTPVSTVHQAVLMLGRNELESLLFSLGVAAALPRPDVSGFDVTDFWTTSGFRAGVAAGIAEQIDPASRSQNFTAALLQDMALPLLAGSVDGYTAIVAALRSDQRLHDIETAMFGWDHTVVGSWMGEEWGFPDALSHGIASHHGGDEEVAIMRAVSEIRGTDTDIAMSSVPDVIESWGAVSRDTAEAIVEEGLDRARVIASLLL
jgi:HD-like signal output (HDOD) protein